VIVETDLVDRRRGDFEMFFSERAAKSKGPPTSANGQKESRHWHILGNMQKDTSIAANKKEDDAMLNISG